MTGDTLSVVDILRARDMMDAIEPDIRPLVCRAFEIRAMFGPDALNEIAVGETKMLYGWLVHRFD